MLTHTHTNTYAIAHIHICIYTNAYTSTPICKHTHKHAHSSKPKHVWRGSRTSNSLTTIVDSHSQKGNSFIKNSWKVLSRLSGCQCVPKAIIDISHMYLSCHLTISAAERIKGCPERWFTPSHTCYSLCGAARFPIGWEIALHWYY